MSSQTVYQAFLNHTLEINPPQSETEIEEIIKNSPLKPSKALIDLWKKVGPTEILYSSIKIEPPSASQEVNPNRFEGYSGFSKVAHQKVFFVGSSWYGTDSRTYWYEIADGEHKGKLVVFSYGALAVYLLDKTIKDLLDCIKEARYSEDVNLSEVLDKNIIGSTPPLKDDLSAGETSYK